MAGRRARWRLVVVRGRSMEPGLRDGDRLLVRWRAGASSVTRDEAGPPPGSVVVVRLPGDRPPAVKRLFSRHPEGWWVERDSPHEGVDSWQVGAIPDDDLLGVVRARVWPRPGPVRARVPPRP